MLLNIDTILHLFPFYWRRNMQIRHRGSWAIANCKINYFNTLTSLNSTTPVSNLGQRCIYSLVHYVALVNYGSQWGNGCVYISYDLVELPKMVYDNVENVYAITKRFRKSSANDQQTTYNNFESWCLMNLTYINYGSADYSLAILAKRVTIHMWWNFKGNTLISSTTWTYIYYILQKCMSIKIYILI